MKSALDDEAPIVALALRTAHGLDRVNGSTRALGRIVGRYVGCRLGARMMGMSTTLEYDEISDIAADVRGIVAWAFDNPDAASSLIPLVEWAERQRHPESLALRAREVLVATRYPPDAVNRTAEELKKRMKR